jgi:hypothetical protein
MVWSTVPSAFPGAVAARPRSGRSPRWSIDWRSTSLSTGCEPGSVAVDRAGPRHIRKPEETSFSQVRSPFPPDVAGVTRPDVLLVSGMAGNLGEGELNPLQRPPASRHPQGRTGLCRSGDPTRRTTRRAGGGRGVGRPAPEPRWFDPVERHRVPLAGHLGRSTGAACPRGFCVGGRCQPIVCSCRRSTRVDPRPTKELS